VGIAGRDPLCLTKKLTVIAISRKKLQIATRNVEVRKPGTIQIAE
jgi:hypothetical protein